MCLDIFVKSLPWPLDIHGSKLSFYRNIFLSQYRSSQGDRRPIGGCIVIEKKNRNNM